MVVRISDKTQNYSIVTKLLVKPIINAFASTDYIRVHINKGFGFYPSDNFNFKYAYGVCSLKKGLFYYLDRIHTSRDIIFNEENIELLSDGVCKLIKTTHTSR